MTDTKSQRASLEDVSSELLTGAMVILLSCAFASVVTWQIIAQLTGWLPDLKAMTADLPPADFKTMTSPERLDAIQESVLGAIVILPALGLARHGVGLIRRNLTLLRARRD